MAQTRYVTQPDPMNTDATTMVSVTNKKTGQSAQVSKKDFLNNPSYGTDQNAEWGLTPEKSSGVPSRYTAPTEGTYASETEKYLKERGAPIDEEGIRQQKVKDVQSTIDAINTKFDNIIKEDRRLAEGAMGQTRSSAARGGLLGSDFGSAQLTETGARNKEIEAADESRRAYEITSVLADVSKRADEEITRKSEAALKGRESYLAFLKENRDATRTDIANLAKSGALKSLDELGQEDYQKLLDQSGYDEATAKLVFNANKPAASKVDYQYKIEGNKLLAYGVDPVTKKMELLEKDLGAPVPSNFKPTVLPDGTLIFTPDKIDPTKPLDEQVLMYGSEGQFVKGGGGSGGGTDDTSQTERDNVAADIAAIRGEDGKLDTAKYQQIRENISVNSPKLLSWFEKTYDPKVVLNPNDPTNPYAKGKTAAEKTNKEILQGNKDDGMTREEAKTQGFSDADIEAVYGADSSEPWWKFGLGGK